MSQRGWLRGALLVAGLFGLFQPPVAAQYPPETIPPDFEADEDILPPPEVPPPAVRNRTSLPDSAVVPFVRGEPEAPLESHAWADLQAQSSVLPPPGPVTLYWTKCALGSAAQGD